jgi:hypothetical protein
MISSNVKELLHSNDFSHGNNIQKIYGKTVGDSFFYITSRVTNGVRASNVNNNNNIKYPKKNEMNN